MLTNVVLVAVLLSVGFIGLLWFISSLDVSAKEEAYYQQAKVILNGKGYGLTELQDEQLKTWSTIIVDTVKIQLNEINLSFYRARVFIWFSSDKTGNYITHILVIDQTNSSNMVDMHSTISAGATSPTPEVFEELTKQLRDWKPVKHNRSHGD